MEKYVINGGKPLHGSVDISGMKNAAVAVIFAAILTEDICVIENVPDIIDVRVSLEILSSMGVGVRRLKKDTIEINSKHCSGGTSPYELVRKMRASYYLLGAELGRFGRAYVAYPGGCDFGVRPIDQHVKGFAAMGATVREGDYICAAAEGGRMRGANIYLDVVSVGATMNIMMAAALADGTTVIENAAKEPHIVDLANFLNSMGADVKGAGTDTIRVAGVERLHGGAYAIIPDQIEAGTYMAAVAATGGQIRVRGIIPKHMDCITAKLQEMGVEVEEQDDDLIVRRSGELRHANVKTLPYPGFPTDMQPQITTVLALASGTSTVTEGVWDSRYRYVGELTRMGAQIRVEGRSAVIEGVDHLTAASVQAYDLRAGAAMVIAALAAEGLGMICAHDLKRPGQENGWRGLCRVENGKPRREALPIRNWGEIYIRLARSILRGGWDELNAAGAINYWWGFASGAVDVQLAPSVPDGPRELLRVLREALVHGELTPFHRRITDQAGTLRNDGEQWFSPETILRMDWLCSNVTGKIPDYEELLPMAQPMVRLLGVYRDALQPKKRGPLL